MAQVQPRQGLVVTAQLGQRHSQQHVGIGQPRFELQGLTQFRNGLLKLLLLKKNQPESAMHFGYTWTELPQLFVSRFCLGIASLGQRTLSPFERLLL